MDSISKSRENGFNRKMEDRDRLVAYVERDLKQFIQRRALELGMSASDYVRFILQNDKKEYEEGTQY